MVTVILIDSGERSVVALTYELVERELVTIPGTKLVVTNDVTRAVQEADTSFVCILESDCLLSDKYFKFMMGHLKKHSSRNITVDSAVTSISRWDNKFYGYRCTTVDMGGQETEVVQPQRKFSSFSPYPIQIAYIPGAFIRLKDLRKALEDGVEINVVDLVKTSIDLSLYFWRHKHGNTEGRIYLNPKTNYVTTEEYVGMTTDYDPQVGELKSVFERQAL